MKSRLERESIEKLLSEVDDKLYDLRKELAAKKREIATLEFARTYIKILLDDKNPSKRKPI
jgi:cob(I)alamin adenosyltransferase